MIVRAEAPSDATAIADVVATAFAASDHGHHGEADLVSALRGRGDLAVSLVAEISGAIVGHVAFSPVTIGDGTGGWYGLAPVAVLPAYRCRGTGAALVEAGITSLRAAGAAGCVVLGDPRYYCRFGFVHDPELTYPGPPPEAFQRAVWSGGTPRGVVAYSPVFG